MTFPSIKVLFPLLMATAVLAAPASAHDLEQKRTISLSATGAVKTTPDKVDISTGVTRDLVGDWYAREIKLLGYSF